MYWADNKDHLNCLTLQEESASTAPRKCSALSGKADFQGAAKLEASPVVVNTITDWTNATKSTTGDYTVYFGDEAGVFYEVLDQNDSTANNVKQTNAWCLPTNTSGTTCESPTGQQPYSIVGSPAIFNPASGSGASYVFVAGVLNAGVPPCTGTTACAALFQFPLPTSTTVASWSAPSIAILNTNQTAPIFGGVMFDYNNNTAYVTTNGTLYTVAFSTTISGTAAPTTLFKVPREDFYIEENGGRPRQLPDWRTLHVGHQQHQLGLHEQRVRRIDFADRHRGVARSEGSRVGRARAVRGYDDDLQPSVPAVDEERRRDNRFERRDGQLEQR